MAFKLFNTMIINV